jgi:UDP-N-acetylglucosamine kinase
LTSPAAPDDLSPAELERIYIERIHPDLFRGIAVDSSPDAPVVHFIAGQPGAGKEAIEEHMMRRLPPGNTVKINTDDLRRYHPRYEEFARSDDLTAASRVHFAASLWTNAALANARELRANVSMSTTFYTRWQPYNLAADFHDAGYTVRAKVVALDNIRSELQTYQRYQNERDKNGFGRFVPLQVQQTAYDGLPEALNDIDTDPEVFHEISVVRPDNQEIYNNMLKVKDVPIQLDGKAGLLFQPSAPGWERPAGAEAAVLRERGRAWGPAEYDSFARSVGRLSSRLSPELLTAVKEMPGRTNNLEHRERLQKIIDSATARPGSPVTSNAAALRTAPGTRPPAQASPSTPRPAHFPPASAPRTRRASV